MAHVAQSISAFLFDLKGMFQPAPVIYRPLPISDMLREIVYDLLHYANKVSPQKGDRWPLGTTLRKNNESFDVCPSVSSKVSEFVASDGYKTDLPLFKPTTFPDLMNDSWKTVLGINGVPVTPTGLPDTNIAGDVCISTVEHDNSQLVWGRDGVPPCDYGCECEALSLVGSPGPLSAYLTPTQQDVFDKEARLPVGPHFCLLCIRRDAHAMHLAYSAFLSSPDVQIERKVFVIPPFQNLVNTAGGYHSWAVLPKATFMPIGVNICGASGTLEVKYNPVIKQFYVDQGGMVYGSDFRRRNSQNRV